MSTNFLESGYKFPIHQSNIFKQWELEKIEIERIKWIESEKQGFDIGWSRAEWVWWAHHRDKWIRGIRDSGTI